MPPPSSRPAGLAESAAARVPVLHAQLPPLLALASLGYVFTQQTALLLRVTLITMGIGLVYWLVVLLPQHGRAWHLLDAASPELEPEDSRQVPA